MKNGKGPLKGFRFIEVAGIGPTQLCGMLLADMGAEIIRVERINTVDLGVGMEEKYNLMNRSRRSVAINLKDARGRELLLELCKQADALFEGFRPGVMERLGLGPEQCMKQNAKLVYGRMTGWGQEGPLAQAAGHDPNYISIAGALGLIGDDGNGPTYPLNIIGDFGGGALYLAMGMLAALLETTKSGKGQVVDAAMIDGVASLLTYFYSLQEAGEWSRERGKNVLDGGAHFLRPYRTSDDQYIVVGALEARFYENLLDTLEIDDSDLRNNQMDKTNWPQFREKLQNIFSTKTRDEWLEIFSDSESCFSPVLSLQEATRHPHALERNSYIDVAGITQPAPAPRFSRTPSNIQSPPAEIGEHTIDCLSDWGIDRTLIDKLLKTEIIMQS
ncbi:MAG: CoA transferase [Gammaproteobacteria bacterium]|nr:CoA transferase [Gammaproteobacteria bacterium]